MTRHALLFALAAASTGCMDFGDVEQPITLASHVDDWRDEIIYQVLVDRFANGDVSNDYGVRFDDLARYQGGDWRGLRDNLDYLEQLGVTTLWISPIIRNVETDANVDGYHGYWAQDLAALNPHFGDITELRALVDDAHARDMKIVVDIVTNHVGQAFYYDLNLNGVPDINFQGNGSGNNPTRHYTEYDPDFDPRGVQAFTSLGEAGPAPIVFQYDPATGHLPPSPVLLQDPAAYNRKGRTFDFDDPDQLLHGDFPGGLKDIDTSRCDVKQMMVDVFATWVEQTDIDGFRIDTVKHVEYEFWRFFTQRLRARLAAKGKHDFLMFGEVFDGRDDLLGSFTRHDVLGPADLAGFLGKPAAPDPSDEDQLAAEAACVPDGVPLRGDQLDSVFYFSQHFQAIRDVFQQAQSTDRIEALWTARQTNWGDTPNEDGIGVAPRDMPINFLDNHDVPRFLYNVRDQDPEVAQALLHNAIAFTFTAPGIPCVYYGTEQGFDGGNDPANRERLWDTGFDITNPTFTWVQRLAQLRGRYKSLRRGGMQVLWSTTAVGDEPDAGIFAFERLGGDGGGSYAVVVFNSHHGQASTTRTPDRAMTVAAPAGTELVDVLAKDGERFVVASDGSLDVTVAPMSAVILVPVAEAQ
ncbi:MAG: alpha-amylase [Deltaproteobacteria bacterium]|nr:alpha-amylase [Deltaproteobacteria bacterium]MBK8239769.1 alpha-amylase [Deltaproteobacteria bacterium]MBK8714502.1 alpha-amylase [Deltaproteobacteria bacterium]MBP7288259.1 alpha-amylase [Nannocystaceae bacterium]